MCAGSAKASLSAHFAKRGNLGELNAVSDCSCVCCHCRDPPLAALLPEDEALVLVELSFLGPIIDCDLCRRVVYGVVRALVYNTCSALCIDKLIADLIRRKIRAKRL